MAHTYCNVPKVWANNEDPDQQSDQGLHCLPFCLHPFDTLFITKNLIAEIFRIITAIFSIEPYCSIFRIITAFFGGAGRGRGDGF